MGRINPFDFEMVLRRLEKGSYDFETRGYQFLNCVILQELVPYLYTGLIIYSTIKSVIQLERRI